MGCIIGDATTDDVAITDLEQILEGLAPIPTQDWVEWCDPATGTVHKCSLDHVICFIHYDKKEVPDGVSLGECFCDDPALRPVPATGSAGPADASVGPDIMSPFLPYALSRRPDNRVANAGDALAAPTGNGPAPTNATGGKTGPGFERLHEPLETSNPNRGPSAIDVRLGNQ